MYPVSNSFELAQLVRSLRIPKPEDAIIRAARQEAAAIKGSQAHDRPFAVFDIQKLRRMFRAIDVPKPERLVGEAGNETATVNHRNGRCSAFKADGFSHPFQPGCVRGFVVGDEAAQLVPSLRIPKAKRVVLGP